jgi:hypothetical protein
VKFSISTTQVDFHTYTVSTLTISSFFILMAPRRARNPPFYPPGIASRAPIRSQVHNQPPRRAAVTSIDSILNRDDDEAIASASGINKDNETSPVTPRTRLRAGKVITPPTRWPHDVYSSGRSSLSRGSTEGGCPAAPAESTPSGSRTRKRTQQPQPPSPRKRRKQTNTPCRDATRGDTIQSRTRICAEEEKVVILGITINYQAAYISLSTSLKDFWASVAKEASARLQKKVTPDIGQSIRLWIKSYKEQRARMGSGTGTESLNEYSTRLEQVIELFDKRKAAQELKSKELQEAELDSREMRDHMASLSGYFMGYEIDTLTPSTSMTPAPLPTSNPGQSEALPAVASSRSPVIPATELPTPREESIRGITPSSIPSTAPSVASVTRSIPLSETPAERAETATQLVRRPPTSRETHLRSLEANRNNMTAHLQRLVEGTEQRGALLAQLNHDQLLRKEQLDMRRAEREEMLLQQRLQHEEKQFTRQMELEEKKLNLQIAQSQKLDKIDSLERDLAQTRQDSKDIKDMLAQLLSKIS